MYLTVSVEREDDGRWLAEVAENFTGSPSRRASRRRIAVVSG
jgi:hypothetical protein